MFSIRMVTAAASVLRLRPAPVRRLMLMRRSFSSTPTAGIDKLQRIKHLKQPRADDSHSDRSYAPAAAADADEEEEFNTSVAYDKFLSNYLIDTSRLGKSTPPPHQSTPPTATPNPAPTAIATANPTTAAGTTSTTSTTGTTGTTATAEPKPRLPRALIRMYEAEERDKRLLYWCSVPDAPDSPRDAARGRIGLVEAEIAPKFRYRVFGLLREYELSRASWEVKNANVRSTDKLRPIIIPIPLHVVSAICSVLFAALPDGGELIEPESGVQFEVPARSSDSALATRLLSVITDQERSHLSFLRFVPDIYPIYLAANVITVRTEILLQTINMLVSERRKNVPRHVLAVTGTAVSELDDTRFTKHRVTIPYPAPNTHLIHCWLRAVARQPRADFKVAYRAYFQLMRPFNPPFRSSSEHANPLTPPHEQPGMAPTRITYGRLLMMLRDRAVLSQPRGDRGCIFADESDEPQTSVDPESLVLPTPEKAMDIPNAPAAAVAAAVGSDEAAGLNSESDRTLRECLALSGVGDHILAKDHLILRMLHIFFDMRTRTIFDNMRLVSAESAAMRRAEATGEKRHSQATESAIWSDRAFAAVLQALNHAGYPHITLRLWSVYVPGGRYKVQASPETFNEVLTAICARVPINSDLSFHAVSGFYKFMARHAQIQNTGLKGSGTDSIEMTDQRIQSLIATSPLYAMQSVSIACRMYTGGRHTWAWVELRKSFDRARVVCFQQTPDRAPGGSGPKYWRSHEWRFAAVSIYDQTICAFCRARDFRSAIEFYDLMREVDQLYPNRKMLTNIATALSEPVTDDPYAPPPPPPPPLTAENAWPPELKAIRKPVLTLPPVEPRLESIARTIATTQDLKSFGPEQFARLLQELMDVCRDHVRRHATRNKSTPPPTDSQY